MNFAKRDKSIVDYLFIIALLAVFMISALYVVLFGARVYERTVSDMDRNFSTRTARSYITEKIRSHDYSNGTGMSDIALSSHEENSVLVLRSSNDGKTYLTYLFVKDGYLTEFTASEEYDFHFDDGFEILPVTEFKGERVRDGLYHFMVKDAYSQDTSFYVALYSGTDGEDD